MRALVPGPNAGGGLVGLAQKTFVILSHEFGEDFLCGLCLTQRMENLRSLRKRYQLSQKQLALLCGVAHQRISDWELGKRPIATELIDKLQDLLGCDKPFSDLRMSRPRSASRPRRSFRYAEVQVDEAVTWFFFGDKSIERKFDPSTRPPDAFLKLVRVDGRAEAHAWRDIAEAGGQPCTLSPVLLGFLRHPLVDGKGWALGTRLKACFLLCFAGFRVYIWPQIWMRLSDTTYRVDALLRIDFKGGSIWVVLEINSDTHDLEKDARREKALDLPVLNFSNQEATSLRFTELLKERILSRFFLQGSAQSKSEGAAS